MIAAAFYLFSAMLLFSGAMVIAARNPVHSVLFLIFGFFNAAGLFVILGAEFLAMLLVVVYVGAVAVLFLFVVMMMDINFRTLGRTTGLQLKSFTRAFLYFIAFLLIFSGISLIGVMGLTNLGGFIFQSVPQDVVQLSMAMLMTDPTHILDLPLWTVMIGVISQDTFSFLSLFFILSLGFSVWLGNFAASYLLRHSFGEILHLFRKGFPVALFVGIVFSIELLFLVRLWHDSSVTLTLIGTSQLISEPDMPNTQALGQVIYTDYLYIFQLSGMILLVAMIGAIVLTLRKREGTKRQVISEQVRRTKADSLVLHDRPVGEGV